MAKIQPVAFPIKKGVATNLDLRVNSFSMEAKSTNFIYILTTDGDEENSILPKIIDSGEIFMDEEDFAKWGEDNNYCIEWACKKLDLSLIKE